MSTTRTSRVIAAPPEAIYRACTDPSALAVWRAPGDMTARVHAFEARVGAGYTMSLFYPASEAADLGKTTAGEDRFTARFLELTPSTRIVEAITFAAADPAFAGEMTMTVTLAPRGTGTEVTIAFDGLPPGIRPEDNEAGTAAALEKLARYVEPDLQNVTIRPEVALDADAIRDVTLAAFRGHAYSQQTEHLIVAALRAAGALAVSLVAEWRGRVVGHVAFSEAAVGDDARGWFLLGPVSVAPDCQRRGIGSALVLAGLDALRTRDAKGCVLVGEHAYYGRFGFRTYAGLSYEGVPGEYVLGLPLTGDPPRGSISAHPAFRIEPAPPTSAN
jgi:putative acetyltransferase